MRHVKEYLLQTSNHSTNQTAIWQPIVWNKSRNRVV